MRLSVDNQRLLGFWLSQQISGGAIYSVEHFSFGVYNTDNKLVGVYQFTNHLEAQKQVDIEVALTDPRAVNRSIMRTIFNYAFEYLGVRRINAHVSVNNPRSIKTCLRAGYQIDGILRQGGIDGEDVILFGMLKSDCRFL